MARTEHHTPDYNETAKGNFRLAYHLEMVSDQERVGQFKKAIDKVVSEDTIFCEVGCGTGIFSIHAARRAKKVYAVELDPEVYAFAKKNIEASGLTNIELINANAMDVELPEKADVVFCEMLSIWMIDEPQVLVMNSVVKNILKPGGVTIPEKIVNLAELCNVDYMYDGIEIKASIAQFTGIKPPRIMSQSKVFDTIRLNETNEESVNHSISFTTLTSGDVNAVRLSSIVKLCDGLNFFSTDTLMPLTIVPLKEPQYVADDANVEVHIKFDYRMDIDDTEFTLVTL